MEHRLLLSKMAPQESNEGGSRLKATKQNFPALKGMSFYKLNLEKDAVREPHWHANADELGYCLSGQILVYLYNNGNVKATFLAAAGDAFFIPSGALHAIKNVGQNPAELILQFSNEEPEDFSLSATFGMFTDAVLGNTWNVSGKVFAPFKRSIKETFIVLGNGATISDDAHYPSPFRYSLESASPLVSNEGGSARVAREDVWSLLKRQALYSLILTGKGMREPH